MDLDISHPFMGLREGKSIRLKASYSFLECLSLFFQMVTKPEHYATHHAGGFTVVGKGRTAGI